MSRAEQAAPGHICRVSDILRRNLKTLLRQTGRSSREVALSAGLSESAIKHILRGASKSPKSDTVAAIASQFGISAQTLLESDLQENSASNVEHGVAFRTLDPKPGDPIYDLDEAALIWMWRRLSRTKQAALFGHLGADDLPSLRKSA